jgi:putative ABC transport system permease protein
MDTIFNGAPSSFAEALAFAALVALGLLLTQAARAPHLARIALRNVPRRKLRTGLIVFGLMLGTMFIAAALAVDDTIVLAVKTVAVFNLGTVDEEVVGGQGPLGLYPMHYGAEIARALHGDADVAGVAPALLVPDVLLADETSGQVRGAVTALALAPADAPSGGTLTDLHAVSGGASMPPEVLGAGEVYLNRNAATLLDAHPGDTLTLYSSHWPGRRGSVRVRAIVTGGPLGDKPYVVLPPLVLQQLVGAVGQINRVYIANRGDGLTGVAETDAVTEAVYDAVVFGPLDAPLSVHDVKRDGVEFALRAEEIFGRILTLFTLFALAIGLMLIFLIFVLLAAERRVELGMARALGMRRDAIARMLLFEGAAYDGVAAAVGLLAGLGLGAAIVLLVGPTIARLGYPLKIRIDPGSMTVAFCLGLLSTLVTIALAAWAVSRTTVAAALRDLPEPPAPQPSLLALARRALGATTQLFTAPGRALGAWAAALAALVTRGVVPLLLGLALLGQARQGYSLLAFSLGLSLTLVGLALVVRALLLAALLALARRLRPHGALRIAGRATLIADRLTALVIGGGLALYWSLPFDALEGYGLPRFSSGIEVFFAAGIMMVLGSVLALAPNLDLLLWPLRWLLARLGRLRHVTAVALIYPAAQRFRTGVGLALFSLVCFTMVVMACIAASTTQTYDNLPADTAGYDIAGQPLFTPVGGLTSATAAVQAHTPDHGASLAAISAATPLPLGIIQPDAQTARWGIYPASEISGAFLDGVGLPLVARASGYATDADVWRAVRDMPGAVVIDVAALSPADAALLGAHRGASPGPQQLIGPPIAAGLPGLSSLETLQSGAVAHAGIPQEYGAVLADSGALRDATLRLRGIVAGPGAIDATPVWLADLRGGGVTKATVIGLVDNSRGQRYGLLGTAATFAPIERGLPLFGNEYYYFKVKPGVDANQQAYALGAALREHGFETTVIQDVLLDLNGPRVFISRVLVGLVGLTLLVGMAALAATGSRAVVERRQQIGMLRALGFRRAHVQLLFLIESLLVGAVGVAFGLALGLVLCQNVFAVDFFAQFQSGLTLVVPWPELALICAAALLAALVAALLPAWQAGRVAPADALRYE